MTESSNPTFSGPYDHEFDPTFDEIEEAFDSYAPLASPWARLAAVILDYLLVFGAMLPGFLLIGFGDGIGSEGAQALGGLLLAGGLIALVVYQVVLLTREGQTIGKRALQLRIVDAYDDSNPGFGRVVGLRIILMNILALVPFVSLIDALMIFTEEHKTIHDRLASTVVVSEKGLFADERRY